MTPHVEDKLDHRLCEKNNVSDHLAGVVINSQKVIRKFNSLISTLNLIYSFHRYSYLRILKNKNDVDTLLLLQDNCGLKFDAFQNKF